MKKLDTKSKYTKITTFASVTALTLLGALVGAPAHAQADNDLCPQDAFCLYQTAN